MDNFINESNIKAVLKETERPQSATVREVIEKARLLEGLNLAETAMLLQCEDAETIEYMFEAARFVKESIYGNRLVLFAPLYINNFCVNNCLYCGFRRDNKDLKRKRLTLGEIRSEIEALEDQGHKRILLVAGEDPEVSNISFLEEVIGTIYDTKKGQGEIRRLNVNVAPMTVEHFRRLKETGIGTYQLFQETYHRETYRHVHPNGPKAGYEWHLSAMDRAMEAGIDDVGIGVLFGLYDYKFEVLALLSHSFYLDEKFGVGPHTISVPRIKPALNAPLANKAPYPVSDEEFKKLVAVIRLAVPYTGIILSTRESRDLRDEVFELGISQISAGSKTNPGAYSESGSKDDEEQFHLDDTRTQLEIIKSIIKDGFFPSFCTACYRTGRTGKDFMDLAKPGDIKKYCLPNCIFTFIEYVLDYGDDELKKSAKEAISREIGKIPDERIQEKVRENIKKIEAGKRDIFL
jgi:2-iminoacetate synthase